MNKIAVFVLSYTNDVFMISALPGSNPPQHELSQLVPDCVESDCSSVWIDGTTV